MSSITEPILLDSTGKEIVKALKESKNIPENVVTFKDNFTPSVPIPRDADTLGGQSSSYYAKQSEVDEIKPYVLKYKDVNIGNVTINQYGYADVGQFIPSNIIVVGAIIQTFGGSTKRAPFNITATGIYMIGEENDVISNVVIRYYYYDR